MNSKGSIEARPSAFLPHALMYRDVIARGEPKSQADLDDQGPRTSAKIQQVSPKNGQTLEQAAHRSGGIIIPGCVQKMCGCGA